MNPNGAPFKVAAILCSILLVGTYISYRSGWLPVGTGGPAPTSPRTESMHPRASEKINSQVMPGSKSGVVRVAESGDVIIADERDAGGAERFPNDLGSKPSELSLIEALQETQSSRSQPTVLPSSKSMIAIPPPPLFPAIESPDVPGDSEDAWNYLLESPEVRPVLPGSKSFRIDLSGEASSESSKEPAAPPEGEPTKRP